MRLTAMRGKTDARDKGGAREKTAVPRSGGRPAPSGPPPTLNRVLAGKSAPASPAGMPRSAGESLEQSVFRSLEQYFANLDGAKPHALHEMVLGAIEKPLLQFALRRCDGNQSAAADLLGINRNTLRRKLHDYGLH